MQSVAYPLLALVVVFHYRLSMCLHSPHLQGRGQGARVANVAVAIRSVVSVLAAEQRGCLASFRSSEERLHFYYATAKVADEAARLDEFMVVINHFRAQRNLVEFLWGQWCCIEKNRKVEFFARRDGGAGECGRALYLCDCRCL
jgi:hypothetical protein